MSLRASTLGRYARSNVQPSPANSLGIGATDDNTTHWEAAIEEEDRMADDKTLRSPADSSRIAMGEDYEVAYWTDKFGVDREALQKAVDAVGNSASAVEAHLKS